MALTLTWPLWLLAFSYVSIPSRYLQGYPTKKVTGKLFSHLWGTIWEPSKLYIELLLRTNLPWEVHIHWVWDILFLSAFLSDHLCAQLCVKQSPPPYKIIHLCFTLAHLEIFFCDKVKAPGSILGEVCVSCPCPIVTEKLWVEYVCVCVHAYVYIYVYVCIYTYVCICTYTFMCTCVYMSISTYLNICVYMYLCIHTNTLRAGDAKLRKFLQQHCISLFSATITKNIWSWAHYKDNVLKSRSPRSGRLMFDPWWGPLECITTWCRSREGNSHEEKDWMCEQPHFVQLTSPRTNTTKPTSVPSWTALAIMWLPSLGPYHLSGSPGEPHVFQMNPQEEVSSHTNHRCQHSRRGLRGLPHQNPEWMEERGSGKKGLQVRQCLQRCSV